MKLAIGWRVEIHQRFVVIHRSYYRYACGTPDRRGRRLRDSHVLEQWQNQRRSHIGNSGLGSKKSAPSSACCIKPPSTNPDHVSLSTIYITRPSSKMRSG